MIEGIAHGTRHVTDTFADLGVRPARLLAVGGGVQNPLWLQATSDVTGLDQIVCARTLGAACGNAYLAALAAGHHALILQLYRQTRDIAQSL